jgi:integrase
MRQQPLRLNFTKKALEGLEPSPTKRLVYHDEHTDGLCLRVEPSGNKSFVWFRKINGRPTFQHIGKFPDLSVENARKAAGNYNSKFADWKAEAYDGANPFERRRDMTLGDVFEDYVTRHLAHHAKNPTRAVNDARDDFERYLPRWKNHRLGTIQRQDVNNLHRQLGENSGHVTANRVVQFLRRLFNYALAQMDWHGESPIKRQFNFYPEQSRDRFLQPDEVKRLFISLRESPNRDLRDFVFMALFTGARKGDILAMRWENVSLETSSWTIPNPKARTPYVVPLLPWAVEILKERHERNGTSGWVFPGKGKTEHITGFKHGWKALLASTKIDGLRMHDLRRTLGSWMATGGASLPTIGKALGHRSLAATSIYARLQLGAVKDAVASAAQAMLNAADVKVLTVGAVPIAPEPKPRKPRQRREK